MKANVAIYARTNGTEPELLSGLRRIVEDRADVVFGVFIDDATIPGKGKNGAWRRLLDNLDQIDQIILNDPGDVPGRTVEDLLAILTTLTGHDVTILVPSLGIDTGAGMTAVIALTTAYRRARKSSAIKRGQERARLAGRRIGRPPISTYIRRRILAELGAGGGVRPAARKFGVSPASVVAIRRSMNAVPDQKAP